MSRVHQIMPGFAYGDAISNEALTLQRWLRRWGHDSEIYSHTLDPRVARLGNRIAQFDPNEVDVTIYHYSIGSSLLDRLYRQSRGKRLLIYHNITPHQFLEPYHKDDAEICRAGRNALPDLASATNVAVGDSAYNCEELRETGFARPRVLPLPIDFSGLESTDPCDILMRRYADDWTNFLFVGRVTPNKCPQDAVRLFAHYNSYIDRRSRLFLVGGMAGMPKFAEELEELIASCGVRDHVVLAGHVRIEELVAYYRLAHLFVCMSEHEGFCVPLLEAAYFRKPVLAFAAAAVPETLGESGVLFQRKDHPRLAEVAAMIHRDPSLRDRIVRRQLRRLDCHEPRQVESKFAGFVQEALAA